MQHIKCKHTPFSMERNLLHTPAAILPRVRYFNWLYYWLYHIGISNQIASQGDCFAYLTFIIIIFSFYSLKINSFTNIHDTFSLSLCSPKSFNTISIGAVKQRIRHKELLDIKILRGKRYVCLCMFGI